jgi:hypothetical protein
MPKMIGNVDVNRGRKFPIRQHDLGRVLILNMAIALTKKLETLFSWKPQWTLISAFAISSSSRVMEKSQGRAA